MFSAPARIGIAAAVLFGTAVAVPATASGAPPGGIPGIAVPPLNWQSCDPAGYQCATAQVPRDYRNPDAGTLTLALKRHQATDQAHRIGSLFVNPGGPGGSGVSFTSAVVSRLPAAAERFDIVGFDPRGIARSGPVLTCLNPEETRQAWAETPGTVTEGAFERGQDFAARFDAACLDRSGDMLPYVGTEYVARDMDLLRAAVGDEKFNYFGVSFGTQIGAVYANLFPDRIRAMSLDGAYDPENYANNPYEYDYWQYVAIEDAFNRFLDWCAGDPATCGFGNGDPAGAFDALIADLEANPVRDPAGNIIANAASLEYEVMFDLNSGRPGWPRMGANLKSAADSRTGSLLDPPSTSVKFYAANTSVECADRVYPDGKDELRAALARDVEAAPRLGAPSAYGPPGYDQSHANACQQWPAERASRYAGPWGAEGSAPILVVGTTGDPDTPYRDAVTLSQLLSNATLLTFDGEGHSGFGRSPCTRAAESDYLVNLTVPAPDTHCTDDPPPTS